MYCLGQKLSCWILKGYPNETHYTQAKACVIIGELIYKYAIVRHVSLILDVCILFHIPRLCKPTTNKHHLGGPSNQRAKPGHSNWPRGVNVALVS